MTAMQIHVNGEPRQVPLELKVADLLKQLGLPSDRVAVEVNLNIVPREDFPHRALKQGDRVEIISFIGGGSMVSWPYPIVARHKNRRAVVAA